MVEITYHPNGTIAGIKAPTLKDAKNLLAWSKAVDAMAATISKLEREVAAAKKLGGNAEAIAKKLLPSQVKAASKPLHAKIKELMKRLDDVSEQYSQKAKAFNELYRSKSSERQQAETIRILQDKLETAGLR